MTMPSNTSQVADKLIADAERTGPLWEDLAIIERIAELAFRHKQDITIGRLTEYGSLDVRVKTKR